MARQSGNSLFSSLRGKIWISTSVLAFFICTFGLISYLIVSLLVNNPFYGVFIPFLFIAFTVMVFGWWLSNEVVNPIENVTLLAKSLERSTSTSIPRSSGSTETDQLLQTIQRNNQQIQKIVTLMEKVANGNLDVTPMQGSDRMSTSFQKLLSKVSESIHAKDELDEIKGAINELMMDVSGVKSGNLDVIIRQGPAQTRELSETIKYLIENLVRLIGAVQDGSSKAESSVKNVETEIQALVQRDEVRVQDMNQASIALKQIPNLIKKITEDLMSSAKSARHTIEKARHGTEVSGQNSSSVSNLRKQVREDVKRIQGLNERSHDIERIAKTVEDLANRTNMIALNASIQATELGEDGHGFVLVAEEVEKLATRANGTNKQISTLNKTILAEIGKVESSVESTMGEVASLSKFAIETGNVLSEMERYVTQFLNLQESLIAYSKDQSEETDNAFKTFADSITDTETTVAKLRDSNVELTSLSKVMRDLKIAVGEFRLGDGTKQLENAAAGHSAEPDMFVGNTESPEAKDNDLYDEFASREFESNVPTHTNTSFDETSGDEGDEVYPANDLEIDQHEFSVGIPESPVSGEFDSPHESLDDLPQRYKNADDGLEPAEYSASGSEETDRDDQQMDSAMPGPNKNHISELRTDSDVGEVFELYNASMGSDANRPDFDSGEFASEDIEEFLDDEVMLSANAGSSDELGEPDSNGGHSVGTDAQESEVEFTTGEYITDELPADLELVAGASSLENDEYISEEISMELGDAGNDILFDSGEFSNDELIEEFDAGNEQIADSYPSVETMLLDEDILDELPEAKSMVPPHSDTDSTLQLDQ